MSERSRRVNHNIEKNPYDPEGITFVYFEPETDKEVGRDNFSLYILIMTGLKDLVLNHPDQIEIEVEEEINGRITAVNIQRKK